MNRPHQLLPVVRYRGRRLALVHPRPRAGIGSVRAPLPTGAPTARPVRLGSPVGLSRDELRSRLAQATIRLLCDDSGSMFGPCGDPAGVRYAAGRSVADLLRRHGGGHLGVIHWGSTAPASLALPPADVRRARRQIRDALSIPVTLGGNNLGEALRLAAQQPPADPGGADLTIVITDGMEDFSLDLSTPLGALAPGSVHILLVDRSRGCSPELEATWRSLPIGSFSRLDDNDVAHLAHQIADLICRKIGARMPTRPRAQCPRCPRRRLAPLVELSVDSNLLRLRVTTIRGPSLPTPRPARLPYHHRQF